MMETLPMACMQQFFQPNPVAPSRPSGCKGVPNPHWIMKSHSPQHEELGDLGDLGAALMENSFIYAGNYGENTSYDNEQVTPVPQSDCITITAINKTPMVTDLDVNWNGRHPSLWTSSQCFSWLGHVCSEHNIEYERLRYRLNDVDWRGENLTRMTKMDFVNAFSSDGEIIHRCLQNVLSQCNEVNHNMYSSYPDPYWTEVDVLNNNASHMDNGNDTLLNNTTNMMNGRHLIDIHNQIQTNGLYESQYLQPNCGGSVKSEVDSEGESNQSFYNLTHYHHGNDMVTTETTELQRRKRGRPQLKDKKKNKNGQRSSRLWEFIRDLLLDSKTCPSLLKWENVDEGIFRFVQSDKVARLWGERKCNPRMTYEKLSRAMRTYYASNILDKVPKTGKYPKKLVYKFGPASGFGSHSWKERRYQTQV